ncbi:MAG: carbohydrate kinase [Deltaproteobacteria bacterium]|nr:carbohydrate kinase [Deltaproteobacteria bacterium]
MPNAIGLDVGTSNVKAVLILGDGTVAASAQRALPTRQTGDAFEQDAELLWTRVADAIAELSAARPNDAAGVAAIGVCSQYSSIVPVDADGHPTADLALWRDARGTARCLEILQREPDAFVTWMDVHGIPPVGNGLSLGHILRFQHDCPEVHARTAAYLEAMDYVAARLTGRIAATQHTMFMAQLCDNRSLGATSYHEDLLRMSGVDASRLPDLVPVDAAVGALRPNVASELGLPPSAVVYAGTNDTSTGAVATGALSPGRGGLAIGTTSVLVDTVDEKAVDLEHNILSMPGPFADSYLVCAENGLGGKLLEHVLENLVHAEDELADHGTDDPYAALDAALAAVPPGAGGLLFLPWLGGALAPKADAAMRGGFLNLSLDTRRTHLVRAVVEGVAHNLRWLLPYVERFTGRRIDEIAFTGGAARSGEWCQIVADVLDRPVARVEGPELAVARAAALLALCRSGSLSRDDLESRVAFEKRYEPGADVRELYAHRQEQFEAAFDAVRPIHQALNS